MKKLIPGRTRVFARDVEIGIPGFENLAAVRGCVCLVETHDPKEATDLVVVESYIDGPAIGTKVNVASALVDEPYFDVPKWALVDVSLEGFKPTFKTIDWFWAQVDKLNLIFQTTDGLLTFTVVVWGAFEIKRPKGVDGFVGTAQLSVTGHELVMAALIQQLEGVILSSAFTALINARLEQAWVVYETMLTQGAEGLKFS